MESFLQVPVAFFNQIWPNVNSFVSRGHQRKNYRFSLICFHCLLVLYDIHENINVIIVFASSRRIETCTFWPLNVKFKIWPHVRSGQGHIMTQVCQYAYFCGQMARKVAWHHLCVSVSIISRFTGEKRFVSSCDRRWPFRGPRSTVALLSSQIR